MSAAAAAAAAVRFRGESRGTFFYALFYNGLFYSSAFLCVTSFFFSLEGGVSGPQFRCLGMQLARSLSERRMCCVWLCVCGLGPLVK